MKTTADYDLNLSYNEAKVSKIGVLSSVDAADVMTTPDSWWRGMKISKFDCFFLTFINRREKDFTNPIVRSGKFIISYNFHTTVNQFISAMID